MFTNVISHSRWHSFIFYQTINCSNSKHLLTKTVTLIFDLDFSIKERFYPTITYHTKAIARFYPTITYHTKAIASVKFLWTNKWTNGQAKNKYAPIYQCNIKICLNIWYFLTLYSKKTLWGEKIKCWFPSVSIFPNVFNLNGIKTLDHDLWLMVVVA